VESRFTAEGVSASCPYRGKSITLGFRAEDVEITPNGSFTGKVFEVEPTGEATYVVIELGSTRVMIRAEKKFRPDVGQEVTFGVQEGQILFFDTMSGKRLRREVSK
jgi:multiple sugar transport system ATP-binding protein